MLPIYSRNYSPRIRCPDPVRLLLKLPVPVQIVIVVILMIASGIFKAILSVLDFASPQKQFKATNLALPIKNGPLKIDQLKALATEINDKKIPLGRFFDDEVEVLASHLTYLELRGDLWGKISEQQFKVLEKATKLEHLVIADWVEQRSLADHLKNMEHLKSLKIQNCPRFNEKLPAGLTALRKLNISNCETYNQPLPDGMYGLKKLVLTDLKAYNQPLPNDLSSLVKLILCILGKYNQPFPENLHTLIRLQFEFLLDYDQPLPKRMDQLQHFIFLCRFYNHPFPESMIALKTILVSNKRVELYLKPLTAIYLNDRDRGLKLAFEIERDMTESKFQRLLFKSENPEEIPLINQCIDTMFSGVLWDLMKRDDIPFVHHDSLKGDPLQKLYIYKLYAKIDQNAPESLDQTEVLRSFIEWVVMTPMDDDLHILYRAMLESGIVKLVSAIKCIDFGSSVESAVRFFLYLLSDHRDKKMILINLKNLEKSGFLELFIKLFSATDDTTNFLSLPRMFTGNRALDSKTCYQKIADKIADEQLGLLTLPLSELQFHEIAPYLTYLDLDEADFEAHFEGTHEWIGSFLERTKQLNCLRISFKQFSGSAFAKLKNVEKLSILEIRGWTEFDNPLFEGMVNLKTLIIESVEYNESSNEPIRLGSSLTRLQNVKFEGFTFRRVLNSIMPLLAQSEVKTLEFNVHFDNITFVTKNFERYKIFWKEGKFPIQEVYNYVLARIIAEQKLSLYQLNLTQEEMLEVAPNLTYLCVDGDLDECPFGEILKKTTKLEHLIIKNQDFTGACFSNFKNISRLKTMVIENCPLWNAPLPDGMAALQTLSVKRCGRFDQPIPMGLDRLTSFRVKKCPTWKRRHLAQYILPVYHYDKERGLTLARSMNVEKIVGHYNSFYEALDESLIATSLEYLLNKRIIFPPKGIKKLESFVRKKSGKSFLQQHLKLFLEHPQLNELIFSIYPLERAENFSLYNTVVLRNHILYLTLLPKMAVYYPDLVFEAVKQCILGQQVIGLDVKFQGSPGMDAGGLSRQFLVQLIEGLLDSSLSKVFKFLMTDDGKAIAQAPLKLTDNDVKNYHVLGMLLGMAFRGKCPIGEVFSEKWLHSIHSFSDEDLNGSIDQFINRLDSISLTTFMEDCTAQNGHLLNGCKTVLLYDTEDEVIEAATTLNDSWGDERLRQLLEWRDIVEIRRWVREIWVADFESYFIVSQAMVRGMRETLSYLAWGDQHSKWNQVQSMTSKKFSKKLQGKLSADWIKQKIQFDYVASEKAIQVKAWLDEWLDEHQHDRAALTNFVQALTGAKTLVKSITLVLSPEVDSLFPHTCGFTVDVPSNIDEEIFRAILDGYAKGEDLDFTRV